MISEREVLQIIEVLRDVARKEIISRFSNKNDLSLRIKTSQIDIVTEADEAAEKSIYVALQTLFPKALIIGEEACEKDPALIGQLSSAPLAILVDPLDGTLNFAQRLPLFGCMVSLLEFGVATAGVIFDPVSDVAHVALKGGGAWAYRGNISPQQLKIKSNKQVSEMTIGLSWGHFPDDLKSTVTRNLSAFSSGFHFRTAAHEYKLICEGFVDVLCYWRIKPWDHAGGALLVHEAGGKAAHFNGETYSPLRQTGGILIAQSETCWALSAEALFAKERSSSVKAAC